MLLQCYIRISSTSIISGTPDSNSITNMSHNSTTSSTPVTSTNRPSHIDTTNLYTITTSYTHHNDTDCVITGTYTLAQVLHYIYIRSTKLEGVSLWES